MAAKFYAVKKGSVTGIFTSWEECRASVHGYPGAEYKSFKTMQEAKTYLGEESAYVQQSLFDGKLVSENYLQQATNRGNSENELKPEERENDGRIPIYVDGSFNSVTKEFSYGMVVLLSDREETFSKKFDDTDLAAMHNVAGEIKGAEAAMQYAIDNKISKIAIYHDYEGIAKWCIGAWKTNKEGTKAYKAFYEQAKTLVDIIFVKVTGHSGDKYNDMADELAKEALGIL